MSNELASPVKSATAALSLAVEFVEGADGDELVLTAGRALLHGIDFGTDNQVHRLLVVGRQVELSVLVGLAGSRVGILRRVVEGVGIAHLDLGGLALVHNLVGKVVVDVRGLLGEGRGLVDDVLSAIGSVKRSIGSVLVDSDHVQVGVVTLVEEDLVALAHDDDIPGVYGARRAHEHGQNAVSSENGGGILLGELLDDGIGRSGDVVGGTVDGRELLLGTLDGLLVERTVVVVEETIVFQVLALISIQVQLSQTVEVNLLEQLPVSLDVNTGIAVASRLVVILPTKATTSSGTSVRSATSVVTALSATSSSALELASSSSATGIATSTALATTASGEDGTSTISCFRGISGIADKREG